MLKIETPLAVRNLPRLILQSAAHNPTAVMIARGDLAVEVGFARLAELQEEILWLCEAAQRRPSGPRKSRHYVRDGVPSRAEVTDAAIASGTESSCSTRAPIWRKASPSCAVLSRMDRHFAKKFARFGSLKAWG